MQGSVTDALIKKQQLYFTGNKNQKLFGISKSTVVMYI